MHAIITIITIQTQTQSHQETVNLHMFIIFPTGFTYEEISDNRVGVFRQEKELNIEYSFDQVASSTEDISGRESNVGLHLSHNYHSRRIMAEFSVKRVSMNIASHVQIAE